MASALGLRHELLFYLIFAIIGRLRWFVFFCLEFTTIKRVFKFINVDAFGLSIPRRVHIL